MFGAWAVDTAAQCRLYVLRQTSAIDPNLKETVHHAVMFPPADYSCADRGDFSGSVRWRNQWLRLLSASQRTGCGD
jgi:hypothetical protein